MPMLMHQNPMLPPSREVSAAHGKPSGGRRQSRRRHQRIYLNSGFLPVASTIEGLAGSFSYITSPRSEKNRHTAPVM